MVETILLANGPTSFFFNQMYNVKEIWLLSPCTRQPLVPVSMLLIPFLLTCLLPLLLSRPRTLWKTFPRLCWIKTTGEDFFPTIKKQTKVVSFKIPDRPSNILCWTRDPKGNREDMKYIYDGGSQMSQQTSFVYSCKENIHSCERIEKRDQTIIIT